MKHNIMVEIPNDMTMKHCQFIIENTNANIVFRHGIAFLVTGEVEIETNT